VFSRPLEKKTVNLDRLKKQAAAARLKGADVALVLDDTAVRVEPSGLSHRTRRRVYKVLTEKGAHHLTVLRFDYDPNTSFVEIKKIVLHRTDGKREELQFTVKDLPKPARHIFWGARMKLIELPRLAKGQCLEVIEYQKGFRIAYLKPGESGGGGGVGVGGGVGGGRGDGHSRGVDGKRRKGEKTRKRGKTHKGEKKTLSADARFVPPLRGHFDDVVVFGRARFPTLYQRYTVRVPLAKRLQYGVYNGALRALVIRKEKHLVYSWWARNLPAFEKEPAMPNPWDALPKVVVSTVPSWKVKSRWFYEVNKDQFKANAAIKKKVAALTRGLRTEREKIIALTRWTAFHIRYRGMSMGREEGYTLHKGSQIFRERAGVCKDIAGMLITLLRAAGFTVYPAMTMAGARVEDVPADQFNHCVVAVKRKDGRYWLLDPTWVPFNRELWSNAERGQHYLVGSPAGELLMRTPDQAAAANWLQVEARSRLRKDGKLSAAVEVSGGGYLESRLRRFFVRAKPAGDTRHVFAQLAATVSPQARVTDYGFADPADLNRRFALRFRMRVDRFGMRTLPTGKQPGRKAEPRGKNGGARLPAVIWLRMPTAQNVLSRTRAMRYFKLLKQKKRRHPALLWLAQQVTLQETLRVPAGYRLVDGDHTVEVENGAASFRGRVEQKQDRLEMRARLVIKKRQYSAKAVAKLKKALAAMKKFAARRYLLVKPAVR
jgi:hypothetical protein